MRVTRSEALLGALLAVLMVGTGVLLMPTEHTDVGSAPPAAVAGP